MTDLVDELAFYQWWFLTRARLCDIPLTRHRGYTGCCMLLRYRDDCRLEDIGEWVVGVEMV